MKAAVVRTFGPPPTYGEFPEPAPVPGESLVTVVAAAASPLAVSRAAGAHYSVDTPLPFVPGVDGVGRTPDGRSVFFSFPRPPFGAMAERVPVRSELMVPLPDGLDDVTAAAAANPGMSCWLPLTGRARLVAGESVLVNGATGAAGRIAVQVAKFLGARKVIATGRDEQKLRSLRELGADATLSVLEPRDRFGEAVRREAHEAGVGVVLDYLWGPTAETILDALGGPNAPRGPAPIRFVQVGSLAAPTITLDGAKLRSSGLDLLGTGLGSVSNVDLVAGMGEFLRALAHAHFRIATEVHPLSDVERAWGATRGDRRVVFTVP